MAARPLPSSVKRSLAAASTSEAEDTTRRRLVAAAAQVVADGGIAAASARAIASAAGASPSAINYNFGSLEQLLLSAFELGVEETAGWLRDRSREITALPPTPDSAASALVHVVSTWTSAGRRLALLYQEALAARPGHGPAAAWTRLWRDFWTDAADHFGLTPLDGRILHGLFEHEALYHLSTWSPALEAAALAEVAEHVATIWLGAAPRGPTGMMLQARGAAGARPHGAAPPAAMRIAKAAAEVVENKGLAGLTHRAVAARADVTTGSVTHHFRSVEDLVAGAIRGQVLMMTEETGERSNTPPAVEDIRSAAQLFEALRGSATSEVPTSAALRRRRLFLAAVRRKELASAVAVIRFSYGGTTRDALGRLFVLSEAELTMHAGALACLVAAIWFVCAGDETPAVSRAQLVDRILLGLSARLRVKTPNAPRR